MSNSIFVDALNEQIKPLLTAYTGYRLVGIAQSVIRTNADKLEQMPGLVDRTGEGTYVGLDDKYPVTIYHKANSVTITEKPGTAYGDSRADQVYTYQNTMIVFMDRKATKLLPDELVLLMRANLADSIQVKNYKRVLVRFTNVVLNSLQVFASEYQNFTYKVPPRFSLFAINYQIESTFDIKCFATCP